MDTHWFVLICVLSPFGDISLYLGIFCFGVLWFRVRVVLFGDETE